MEFPENEYLPEPDDRQLADQLLEQDPEYLAWLDRMDNQGEKCGKDNGNDRKQVPQAR